MPKPKTKRFTKKRPVIRLLIVASIFILGAIGILYRPSHATPVTPVVPVPKAAAKVQAANVRSTQTSTTKVKSASTQNTPVNTPKVAQPATVPTLLFADDFSGPAVDSSKWTTCYPKSYAFSVPCAHPENKELELYTSDNVTADGVLSLTAQNNPVNGYSYTSGLVQSHGNFDFTYGYLEARLKVPAGKGFWPTFWLVPSDGSWPPEIDIMENYSDNLSINRMTVFPNTTDYRQQTYSVDVTQFHTYGLDWQADGLKWYIDGKLAASDPAQITKSMYIIFNLAVGGTGGGAVGADTVFPSSMQIDYVKVWNQKP